MKWPAGSRGPGHIHAFDANAYEINLLDGLLNLEPLSLHRRSVAVGHQAGPVH